jgi:DNA-binding MarR family transcriptional regulator
MKRNPHIPNPDKGKKPNREKSFTKSRSFAQSDELKVPIKLKVLGYMEVNSEPISYRELQDIIKVLQTSIHRPMKALEKANRVSYKLGRHRFSNRLVKKFFLQTDENRIQLNLFSHEG